MKTVIALALVAATGLAHAATTGTLLLKGVVTSAVSIAVTPETIASTLPLDTTQNRTKVGTVREESNSGRGYRVTINSANRGRLTNASRDDAALVYRLSYNNQNVNLSSGQTFTYNEPRVATDRDLRISYTGDARLPDGTYSDTLTFTIATN